MVERLVEVKEVGLVVPASFWGESVWRVAYLHHTLTQTKELHILLQCTRCLVQAMPLSYSWESQHTNVLMLLLLFAMRLWLGLEILFMVVLVTSLLFNNRFISLTSFLPFISLLLCSLFSFLIGPHNSF